MAESILDGNNDFLGGQDHSKEPDKIAPNAYSAGINVTTQNGSLSPRWGQEEQVLDFSNTGNYALPNLTTRTYEDIFYTGKFQAAIPYSVGTTEYVIFIVSGIIYLVNKTTLRVDIIEISDGSFISEDPERINWTPASRYLVIFDWPNNPVILEGISARRADPTQDEVPVSNMGVFNQNRLFIANFNEFTAGDPIGIGFPDAPITFEEILAPSTGFTGQSFQLSTNYSNDPITAMIFLQVADTSTGIGPMLVATQTGIWSYATQNLRSTWTQGQFGSCLTYNNGVIGPQAITNVNSEIFYMSADGQIRNIAMSREEQASWSKVGMSREVQNWLKFWDLEGQGKYTDLSYFNNKVFVTANPFVTLCQTRDRQTTSNIAFGGFAVLEADNISNLTSRSQPCWAGVWTGTHPMQTAVSGTDFFVAVKRNGKNALFKFTPNKTVDVVDGKERLIRSRVYTRMYDCQLSNQDKTVQSTQIELENVTGKLQLDLEYRTAISDPYYTYQSFTHEAPYQLCTVPQGKQLHGLGAHNFPRLNMGSPIAKGCNPVTKEISETFRKLQYKITITGRTWEIGGIILNATVSPQNNQINSCKNYPAEEIPQDCSDDWAVPENDLCEGE